MLYYSIIIIVTIIIRPLKGTPFNKFSAQKSGIKRIQTDDLSCDRQTSEPPSYRKQAGSFDWPQFTNDSVKVFVFNTNLAFLTFLHKIDNKGFKKFLQKIKLPPVGIELTTPTINGLEVRCLLHSAT